MPTSPNTKSHHHHAEHRRSPSRDPRPTYEADDREITEAGALRLCAAVVTQAVEEYRICKHAGFVQDLKIVDGTFEQITTTSHGHHRQTTTATEYVFADIQRISFKKTTCHLSRASIMETLHFLNQGVDEFLQFCHLPVSGAAVRRGIRETIG